MIRYIGHGSRAETLQQAVQEVVQSALQLERQVKSIEGFGTTIDVLLVNGELREVRRIM